MTSPRSRLTLHDGASQKPKLRHRDLIVSTCAGLTSGCFAAYAYYDVLLRPLSHTFGIWITLIAVLSARHHIVVAILRSVAALVAAVLAFYLGKKIMYGLRYPDMPYSLSTSTITTWLVLAFIVGLVLGPAFSYIGRAEQVGSLATGGAIGLLLADTFRRASNYSNDSITLIIFALIAVFVLLAVAIRTPLQLASTAAWTLPMAAVGYLLVNAPDLLQQLLLSGPGG